MSRSVAVVPVECKRHLCNINPWTEFCRIKVQLTRLWSFCDYSDYEESVFLEGLLVDKLLNRIHCVVKKDFIKHFQNILRKGCIYYISRFIVVPNNGSTKVTRHRYKLMFDINTEVEEVTDINFPRIPYTLYKLEDLFVFRKDSSYLIDLIGFLISVREYPEIQHGYADRMKLVVIQLYANGSYVLCYLYGEFFNRMSSALMNSPNQAPIVLLESFKVRVSRGFPSLENVINCSRILINPDLPETADFIYSLNPLEPCFTGVLSCVDGSVSANIDDDFVNFSNAANILRLKEKDEDGIYNVVETIKSIHNYYDWWYYCCPCGIALELLNNGFRCSACERDIKNPIKKFKVIVDVEDYSGHSIFILYDRAATLLLKRKLCDVIQLFEADYPVSVVVVYVPSYPPSFDDIIGKEVVLKVDRKRVGYAPYIGTFKVINCCDDVGVISKFKIEEVSNEVTSIPMLFPIFEDFGQNAKSDVNLKSLGCRLSIPPEILRTVGVDTDALIDKHNFRKPDPCVFLVGTIASICNDKQWCFSICLCGEEIEALALDSFCSRCLTHWSDGILRFRVRVVVSHSRGSNLLILHDRDITYLMKKNCSDLLEEHPISVMDEKFALNGSELLSNLVSQRIICMVDPNGVQEYPRTIFYNVFRSSDDALLIKLFEDAIGDQTTIGDESFRIHSRGDSFPAASSILSTKTLPVDFSHHLICSKKLKTQFESLPASARKRLEDAFEAWMETNAIGGHKP